jgi:hypothetical protein
MRRAAANSMTGLLLSAWILFPLLLLGASAGCGLLVRRISAGALSGVLLLPVGFALTVALCTLGTSITWLAPYAGALTVAVAACGFILEHRSLRMRPTWRISSAVLFPAIAAFAAFAAIGAPVVLTGTPTWTGFSRIVDIAFQMAFSQHLAEAGRSVPVGNSSFNETVEGLTGNGYPGGAQATLGAMAGVIRTGVPWCYQAYLAWTAAMGALALFALLRKLVTNPILCCLGAAVAIQPNILYGYALEGGIKELATAALILLVSAIVVEWLAQRHDPERHRSVRSLLPLAPAVAAAAASFSYGVGPWLGLILLSAFVLSMFSRGRWRTLAAWCVTGVATAVLATPTVIAGVKLFGTAKEAVKGVVEVGLGNLAGPVPEISSVGVWISSDYRFPAFAHAGVSRVFDVAIIVLGAIGALGALWRRRWMIAAFGATAPIALAYYVAHSGPWVELKAYTITATMFVAMAFVGAGWLAGSRSRRLGLPLRAAGWLGALAVSGAVLYGNALTYHDESIAPAARYRQLEQIGTRFAGMGPTLYPAFDEYSEYFLRRESGWDLVRPIDLQIRPGAVNLPAGQFAFALDVNQLELSYVERFPLLVLTHSPVTSRAPANYALVDRTSDFEVWRRMRPASEVFAHFPLSGSPGDRTSSFCRTLSRSLRAAGAGASIAYVPSGLRVSLVPTQTTHPSYWHPAGPESLRAHGAGTVDGSVSLPADGTYDISMPGSVGRELTLYVDGHRVGSVGYEERYPSQYLRFARIKFSAGAHRIRLSRPNGSLDPGSGDAPDGNAGIIGPLLFTYEAPGTGQLHVAPARDAAGVCSAHAGYQWIEVLRPGATTQDALAG